MAGIKADRVAGADAPLPELSGKGAPLHEEPLAEPLDDGEPDPDDIPAELKEPEPAAANGVSNNAFGPAEMTNTSLFQPPSSSPSPVPAGASFAVARNTVFA